MVRRELEVVGDLSLIHPPSTFVGSFAAGTEMLSIGENVDMQVQVPFDEVYR